MLLIELLYSHLLGSSVLLCLQCHLSLAFPNEHVGNWLNGFYCYRREGGRDYTTLHRSGTRIFLEIYIFTLRVDRAQAQLHRWSLFPLQRLLDSLQSLPTVLPSGVISSGSPRGSSCSLVLWSTMQDTENATSSCWWRGGLLLPSSPPWSWSNGEEFSPLVHPLI